MGKAPCTPLMRPFASYYAALYEARPLADAAQIKDFLADIDLLTLTDQSHDLLDADNNLTEVQTAEEQWKKELWHYVFSQQKQGQGWVWDPYEEIMDPDLVACTFSVGRMVQP
ncbi:hypothetical protein NDU88_001868 [Pleurodeles waltl]|uniref:Uncharacterized protein n=1 Tax=Pleurodeles waltl TaxID=8319 RepID=A0AAV7NCC9_PLEWA|nr:hypothetical protein NDU88_001868 [Pleurodeles waltl]